MNAVATKIGLLAFLDALPTKQNWDTKFYGDQVLAEALLGPTEVLVGRRSDISGSDVGVDGSPASPPLHPGAQDVLLLRLPGSHPD